MPFLSPAPPFFPATAFVAVTEPFGAAWDFFQKGGIFMIPLVVCSLAAVMLVLLRFVALRRENVLPRVLASEIARFPSGGNPEALGRLAGGDPSALAQLTRVALDHLRWPRAENVEAVQTAARREVLRLENGLGGLELIVGIAPLLGLLGAVSGLVRLFSNFGAAGAQVDNARIAAGIAEALNTTIVGLAIAIPTLCFYTYFNKRVEALSVEMEGLLADLLTKCYLRAKPVPTTGRLTAATAEESFEEPAATAVSRRSVHVEPA